MVLNFKRLSYTTHWTPTSLATEVLQQHNVPPSGKHPDGRPHYTLPALIDHTPQDTNPSAQSVRLSDSTRIIEYLERAYPEASLPAPDAGDDYPFSRELYPANSRALHAFVENHIQNVMKPPIYNLYTVALYKSKLPHDQVDYAARKLGAPGVTSIEDLEVNGTEARAKEWEKLRNAFRVLEDVQKEAEAYYSQAQNPGIPSRDGTGVPVFQPPGLTYSDFAVAAVLMMIRNLSPDEAWPKVRVWDSGRWGRLFQEVERRWAI
ncbi:hypothetical protein EWM64_g8263 [Hericium alpestre]|uniref:GST N-terminal domain-containing protein n=1 Tax=Hericium alpestre TaxID=135208 RepID=A0A4Y9ZNB7_9AGAM|nr:hypothetical protein EWM64_g8263 [Hericium alpestre]